MNVYHKQHTERSCYCIINKLYAYYYDYVYCYYYAYYYDRTAYKVITARAGQPVPTHTVLQANHQKQSAPSVRYSGRQRPEIPASNRRPPNAVSTADQHAWHQYAATLCIWTNNRSTRLPPPPTPPLVRVVTYIKPSQLPPTWEHTPRHFHSTIGPNEMSQAGSPDLPSRQARGIAGENFDFEMAEWVERNAPRYWRRQQLATQRPAGCGHNIEPRPNHIRHRMSEARPLHQPAAPDLSPSAGWRAPLSQAPPAVRRRRRRHRRRQTLSSDVVVSPQELLSSAADLTLPTTCAAAVGIGNAQIVETDDQCAVTSPSTMRQSDLVCNSALPVVTANPAAAATILVTRRIAVIRYSLLG
jgi:hypothetical protein